MIHDPFKLQIAQLLADALGRELLRGGRPQPQGVRRSDLVPPGDDGEGCPGPTPEVPGDITISRRENERPTPPDRQEFGQHGPKSAGPDPAQAEEEKPRARLRPHPGAKG